MGQLIIIEGGDGSGKATQTKALVERLQREGKRVRAVSFPQYDSPASMPVQMYLHGDFGSATDVDPYVASAMYAIDRFASYRMDWRAFYEGGGIIVADRYTTSNMVHQMVKYDDSQSRSQFLQWLDDFEYNKCGLPRPDVVCLLDVPLRTSEALMAMRTGKTGGTTGDVHELNHDYLMAVHNAYDELVCTYGWHRIACVDDAGIMRSIQDIHDEVYRKIAGVLL